MVEQDERFILEDNVLGSHDNLEFLWWRNFRRRIMNEAFLDGVDEKEWKMMNQIQKKLTTCNLMSMGQ